MKGKLKRGARVELIEYKLGCPLEAYLRKMAPIVSQNKIAKTINVRHSQVCAWFKQLGLRGCYAKGQPHKKIKK